MELDLLKNFIPAPREQQREMLDHQRPEGCSTRRGCEVIEFLRSTCYHRSTMHGLRMTDEHLVELINGIQDGLPGYGYRRLTHELRRRNHAVNYKRVAQVMAEHALGIKRRRCFVRTTDSDHDGPIFPNFYRNDIPAKPNLV